MPIKLIINCLFGNSFHLKENPFLTSDKRMLKLKINDQIYNIVITVRINIDNPIKIFNNILKTSVYFEYVLILTLHTAKAVGFLLPANFV